MIIVVIVGDVPNAQIGLWDLLCCHQMAQLNDGVINAPLFTLMVLRYHVLEGYFLNCWHHDVGCRQQGKLTKSREQNLSVWWKSDNSVSTCTPAFGIICIRVVIIGMPLQMLMRMIVAVHVYVRLSLEIYRSWRVDYIQWPLPRLGYVPPLQSYGVQ